MTDKSKQARARWRDAYRAARLGNLGTCAFQFREWFPVLHDAHGDRLMHSDKHALNRLRSFDSLWGCLRRWYGVRSRSMAAGDAERFSRWRD